MIPKIMNFFYVGRMSWMRYLTLYSFRKLNPEYEINLYTTEESYKSFGCKTWSSREQDDSSYTGKDYWSEVRDLTLRIKIYTPPKSDLPPAHLSDLFQWWILGREGGFYADMDILWIKSLKKLEEEIRSKKIDSVWCFSRGQITIGFFAACIGCKIFQDIYNAAIAQSGGAYQQNGAHLLKRMFISGDRISIPGPKCIARVRKIYPQYRSTLIDDYLIYPFDWLHVKDIFLKYSKLPEESIGIHWFGADQTAQEFNLKYTPENWRRFDNTFSQCLQELGL